MSIPLADALSKIQKDIPAYNIYFLTDVSSPADVDLVKSVTAQDPTMSLLKEGIYKGWPSYRKQCSQQLYNYGDFRYDLVLED